MHVTVIELESSNFTCGDIVALAEHYCKHSGHVVVLYICRYKDYKLKNVQICHFLDSLPATGMSKSSFSCCLVGIELEKCCQSYPVLFHKQKRENPRKFSLQKSYFSPICESFLPRKLPAIYTVLFFT